MVIVVLLWVVCAGLAALIAGTKGRSAGGFAVAGLLLGPVGVLWAAFAFRASELEPSQTEKDRSAARFAWLQTHTGWPRT
jgi:hypothetical protein